MKALMASISLLAMIGSAQAAQLAIAGSGGTNVAQSGAQVATTGLAVGVARSVGVSAGTSAGIAVSTPVGSLAAGVGQTNNFGAAGSAVIAGFGGAGAAGAAGGGTGINVGGGITLP